MKKILPGKPVYHRHEKESDARPKWVRIWDASKYSGLNKDELRRLDKEGLISSFLYLARPDSKGGIRLFDLDSIYRFLEQKAAEAKAVKEGR